MQHTSQYSQIHNDTLNNAVFYFPIIQQTIFRFFNDLRIKVGNLSYRVNVLLLNVLVLIYYFKIRFGMYGFYFSKVKQQNHTVVHTYTHGTGQ